MAMQSEKELPAGERAYRAIRDRIVRLEFAPSQIVGEAQLAEMLGVSRTPVREALTRLGDDGLVDFRSRSRTIVAPIRLEAVRAAQFIREKLEVSIVEEAATCSDARFRFMIRQAIEEQRFAVEQEDTGMFFASDEKMHQTFAEGTGRPLVWPVIADAKMHMDRVRWLSLEKMDLNLLLQDHADLLDAVERNDPGRARAVMECHLRRVMEQLDELMAVNPGYFESVEEQERMAV